MIWLKSTYYYSGKYLIFIFGAEFAKKCSWFRRQPASRQPASRQPASRQPAIRQPASAVQYFVQQLWVEVNYAESASIF